MQRPQDRLYALANVVDWSEPMQPPKSNYRISLWELLSEFLEQPRHIDFKKMDHHYSTVLELLVIGLEITIREERIRQAIRQRAALYPSSSALVDSTELFYTGSNGRVGRSAVRIANSTEGKLYMAENDETAFESSLDQSTDEKNKDKAPRALWMSLDVDEERWIVVREYKSCESQLQYYEIVGTSIIVEEYSPDVLFDLLDMEEDGNGSSLDLDVCFDEEDYLLWLVYTHSADMGVLNDEEIGEYLRYEVMRFDLSSFAVLTEESGTSDENCFSDTAPGASPCPPQTRGITMPAKPASASSSALSTLVGRSMWMASPGSSDEHASRPPPRIISRESAARLVGRDREPEATPPRTKQSHQDVLESLFARAGEFKKAETKELPLAKTFRTAAFLCMAASLLSTVLSALIWRATAWAYPASNAIPTAILSFIGMSCLINISFFHWLLHQTEVSFHSRVWDMAATFLSKPTAATRETEAAHWLNDILDSIWPFLNPDIFKPLTNIMEATIQANSPPFVSGVSIEDMGQGSKPIRIVGIRRLPKQPVDEEDEVGPTSGVYDEIMSLKPGLKNPATELSTSSKKSAARELRERLKMLRERTSVHVEVAFDYGRAEKDRDDHDDRKKMHVLLVFRLVGGVRVPVWINMDKIVGLLRARVQLKPDPPFVGKAVISLLRKPEIQFACLPLFKSSMNVMGMPLVSNLVRQALEAALAAYISPRSINIDLGALLVGETTSQDVYPLGVIIAKMHRVHHLEAQWARDDFSSFLSVGWAKTGDPLYIYRTIYADTSPRWEEGMAYCVGPEEVNAQDSLNVDFTRVGSMDNETVIGSCKVLLADVISSIEYTGKLHLRTDDLCEDDGHSVAKLDWSIGFYPKAKVSLEQLQKQKIYPPIKDHAEFEQRVDKIVRYKFREAPESAQDEYEREKNAFMQEAELKIMNSQPPVDRYPCGILHVELPSMSFLSTSRAVRETDESDEMIYDDQTPDAPTAYANIYINQHRVTRTLIKPRNSDPNFGSEVWRFVRDWRAAEVIVVVRDKKRHRTDTFLGAVRINIADLLERHQASRVTLAFPIEGGEGSGLANMTILFRALNMYPPPEQRSWDYGTLQISMPTDSDATLQELKHSQLTVCSALEEWKLYPNHSLNPLAKDPHQLAWFPKDKHKSTVSFPVKNKYAERIVFQWSHGATKRHWSSDKVAAYSFWKIEDLIEHQEKHLRIPVYSNSLKWVDDSELWPENHVDKTPIGYVEFSAVFRRGLTADHAREMKSKDVDEIMEVEEALGPNPQLTIRPF